MDGKTGAEELIGKMLTDPTLLKTIAAAPKPQDAPPATGAQE
jgi:type VI secretion system protein ImpB